MTVKVTLKLATSLDGRIATASGQSKWITGEAARAHGHGLRAAHQAVIVGVGTAIADNPALTVRTPGYTGPQPTRVVLDSRQRLPAFSAMVQTARKIPTIVISIEPPLDALAALGVTVLQVAETGGRVDVGAALDALAARGLERVMIEGGGETAASIVASGRVDEIAWYRAPILLGAEGRPAIGGLVLRDLAGAPRFRRVDVTVLGDDVLERYERI